MVVHEYGKGNKIKQQFFDRHNQRLAKNDTSMIKKLLDNSTTNLRRFIMKELIQNNIDVIKHINDNPLTEEDIVEMIQDYNLTDTTMINILKKLARKWGRDNVITKNISKKLVNRKKLTDQFFTKKWTDKNTEYYFKSNDGKCLERWVVYCHDIPGLLAFKNLIEANEETEDNFNVIGADDGKGILKII